MFSCGTSVKRRGFEREVLKLRHDLSFTSKKLTDLTAESSATEIDLLARVEKSLKIQLALRKRITECEEENNTLRSITGGSSDGVEDPAHSRTGSVKSNSPACEQERLEQQNIIEKMTVQLLELQERTSELESDSMTLKSGYEATIQEEFRLSSEKRPQRAPDSPTRIKDLFDIEARCTAAGQLASDFSRDNEKLLKENAIARPSFTKLDSELEYAQRSLSQSSMELTAVEAERDNLLVQMMRAADPSSESSVRLKETALLKKELSEANSLVKDLQREKEVIGAENAGLTLTLTSADTELETIQKQLQKMEKEMEGLTKERNDSSSQLNGNGRDSVKLSQHIDEIKEDMDSELEGDTTAGAKQGNDAEITNLKNLLEISQRELKELDKKSTTTERSLQAQLNAARISIKGLEGEKETLASESAILTNTLNTTDEELEACAKKLQKSEREMKVLISDKASLSLQLENLKRAMEEMKQKYILEQLEGGAERKVIERRKPSATGAALDLPTQLDNARDEAASETMRSDALQEDVVALQAALTAAKLVASEASREKEFLRAERDTVLVSLDTAEIEMAKLVKDHAKAAIENTILRNEKEALSLQLSSSQEELCHLKNIIEDIKRRSPFRSMDSPSAKSRSGGGLGLSEGSGKGDEVSSLRAHLAAIKHELSCKKSDNGFLTKELSTKGG